MDKAQENAVKEFLAEKIAEGLSLSEAQKEINAKFSLKLTFMDVRVLASELNNVDWSANDPKAAAAAKEKAKREAEEKARAEAGEDALPAGSGDGKTSVTVNKISRPGMLYSGSVTFASGSTADWYVDQTGRPGIENLKGNPPTQEEAEAFMTELQKVLR